MSILPAQVTMVSRIQDTMQYLYITGIYGHKKLLAYDIIPLASHAWLQNLLP